MTALGMGCKSTWVFLDVPAVPKAGQDGTKWDLATQFSPLPPCREQAGPTFYPPILQRAGMGHSPFLVGSARPSPSWLQGEPGAALY